MTATAAEGVRGTGSTLPHLDLIQRAFAPYDVSGISAHVGGAAATAAGALGAEAYATGNSVAFRSAPDLHTAAHEAAHVVQQRSGVQLKGGVGEAGDVYEQQADAVADAVVRGESAAPLFGNLLSDGNQTSGRVQFKKKSKKKKKPGRVKADGTKQGEAIQHLYKAEDTLNKLNKMGEKLYGLTMKDDKQAAIEFAKTMVPVSEPGREALSQAWRIIHEYVLDEAQGAKKSVQQVKAEVMEHPGMGAAINKVTYAMSHYLSHVDSAIDKAPEVRMIKSPAAQMLGQLSHVRGNLGLDNKLGWAGTKALTEIVVKPNMVNLGSGSPRDQIQEAVITLAVDWNRMMSNFSAAVGEFVQLIQHAQFKSADPGLIGKLWGHAKGLLEKGATLVSGTPLAAKLGFKALEYLYNYEQEMELARKQGDEASFLDKLQKRVAKMQLDGAASGANPSITKMVSALDAEFLAKKTAEDEWKLGDKAVFGEQATFLKELTKKAEAYHASVPTQDQFTAGFLQEWVTANHKERRASAWRSPFADSKYWDGYVGISIELGFTGVNWYISENNSATLHCPKAGDVAKAMVRTLDPFHLGKLDLPIHVKVGTVSDVDREALPKFMSRDRSFTIRLNASGGVEGAGWLRDAWKWIQKNTEPAHHIMARFDKLSG